MEHIVVDITKPLAFQMNDTVFSIGRFQALHLGHQHLIKEAKRLFPNKKQGILTFSPDPRDFFSKNTQPKILTAQERYSKLEQLGIDVVVEFVFNQAFANMTKQSFIELLQQLNIEHVIHGQDFRFGSVEDDSTIKNSMLIAVEDLKVENMRVSSSQMNMYLQAGKIDMLNQSLGYTYSISGHVISGEKIARKLGFPTANVQIPNEKMLPGDGVYITQTYIDGEMFESVTHVGTSPTFQLNEKKIESHILKSIPDIYEKEITIFFLKKIRDVQKFDNIEMVKLQIDNDIEQVKQYFNKENH